MGGVGVRENMWTFHALIRDILGDVWGTVYLVERVEEGGHRK